MSFKKMWQWIPPDALNFMLRRDAVRKIVLRKGDDAEVLGRYIHGFHLNLGQP